MLPSSAISFEEPLHEPFNKKGRTESEDVIVTLRNDGLGLWYSKLSGGRSAGKQ